jgi:hypothetical protein
VHFAAITLCVTSQRVFIAVSVYFVIDSVRKLLDTPSYSVNTSCSSPIDIERQVPFAQQCKDRRPGCNGHVIITHYIRSERNAE